MARFSLEMAKKSVGDLTEADLKGKRVLVRCDLNVPLEKGVITDDTRIRGSIPTIKYLQSKGAKVLLSSHLGRPKGGYEAKFSLAPIAPRLAELLGTKVPLVPDCIGVSVGAAIASMNDGDVCLLENVRFYPEEEKNDKEVRPAAPRLQHTYCAKHFSHSFHFHPIPLFLFSSPRSCRPTLTST